MHAKLFRLSVTAFLLCGLLLLAPQNSSAQSYKGDFFPLEKVKRGQKGYGLTTMQGTTPERFTFEVIGVNRNFLPKMDIILVKSDDPKIQVTGFWQGMSGSPLFIDGKLVCAFSYGFRFNKRAIGGCTPLKYMKEEGFQKRRGASNVKKRRGGKSIGMTSQKAPRNAASLARWLQLAPQGDISHSMRRRTKRAPWLLRDSLPKRAQHVDPEHGMQASAVPLALSGFSAPAFAEAKRLMAGFPLEPMQAGGTGDSNAGPTQFQMGGSIAVQLVRGDMSAAATGTVSLVDKNKILAFGHPMFKAGEIYAPVTAAEVHTVIPSAQSAFVVASPLRELGALTQDRQSTIAADTSLKVDMIPMHIRIVSDKGKKIGRFDVELIDSRFFTPTFANIAASNAISLYVPDRDHVSLKMKSRVGLKGFKALEFTDYLHNGSGAGLLVGAARGLRVLSPLYNNPFSPVEVTSIDLEIEVGWNTNVTEIVSVALPSSKLTPGQENYALLTVKPYHAKKKTVRIPFMVPKKLAGSIVRIDISAGDDAGLYIAPPDNIRDLVKAYRTLLPGTVYAISLFSAQEAAAVDGILIQDLPASALNRLRTASRTPTLSTQRVQSRSVIAAKTVLIGEAVLFAKVGNLP